MKFSSIEKFRKFLDASPTSWHAVKEIKQHLINNQFICLKEEDKWKLEPEQKYFVEKKGSLCAFILPKQALKKILVFVSHTDSPCLKIKPQANISEHKIHSLSTEIYGSPLLSSWFNRDLALAGKVFTLSQHEVHEHLIFLEHLPVFIPSLPVHLQPELAHKSFEINKQQDMRPILTIQPDSKFSLNAMLQETLQTKEILSYDLCLVPLETSRLIGAHGEMLASYRLDNLASVHPCMETMAEADPAPSCLQMASFWDGEEIGSEIPEGAASTFFHDVVKRIQSFYQISEEDYIRIKTRSLCLSLDVAHAYHPGFPDKYDLEHLLIPGKGIALKSHVGKNYITDSKTAAEMIAICRQINLPFQHFVFRNDIRGGSTLGPIFATHTGISTMDIGCPVYSMHSIREVLAIQDQLEIYSFLRHFLKGVQLE